MISASVQVAWRDAGALLGRAAVLERLVDWAREGRRLVTILGPPGVGKTALWEAALGELGAGALAVRLSDAASVDAAMERLHEALTPGTLRISAPLTATLLAAEIERAGARVIGLDNAEHLLPELVARLEPLIAQTPTVCWVVTSRVRLGVVGEQLMELAPLTLPDATAPLEALREADAVRLLMARLNEHAPATGDGEAAWRSAARVAAKLDGLPLAIELVAARARVLSLAEIEDRMGQALTLLKGRHGGRAVSLEQALEESVEALPEQARLALAALARLNHALSGEEACALLEQLGVEEPLDVLQLLRDRSLLARQPSDGRLSVYQCVRQVTQRRPEWARADAWEALDEHWGQRARAWVEAIETRGSLRAMTEIDALRDVLSERVGALAKAPPEATGVWWIANALALYLERHGSQARREAFLAIVREALARPEVVRHAPLRPLIQQGALLDYQGYLEEARALLAAIEARPDAGAALGRVDVLRARLLTTSHQIDEARVLYRSARRRFLDAGEALWAARVRVNEGNNAFWKQDMEGARQRWQEALDQMDALGDTYYACLAVSNLCMHDAMMSRGASARALAARALQMFAAVGDRRGEWATLANLGMLAMNEGDMPEARRCFEQNLALQRDYGELLQQSFTLSNLAQLACERDEPEQARAMMQESEAIAARLQNKLLWLHNAQLRYELAVRANDPDAAAAALSEALAHEGIAAFPHYVGWYSALRGALKAQHPSLGEAHEDFEAARRALEGITHPQYRRCIELALALAGRHEPRWPTHARALAVAMRAVFDGELVEGIGVHNTRLVRVTAGAIWAALDEEARHEVEGLARDPRQEALWVSPDGGRWRVPGQEGWEDRRARPLLVRLFELLREAHPAQALDEEALKLALWPEEYVAPDAASNRIHNAVALLRRAGLKELIVRDEGGYRLREGLALLTLRAPARLSA